MYALTAIAFGVVGMTVALALHRHTPSEPEGPLSQAPETSLKIETPREG